MEEIVVRIEVETRSYHTVSRNATGNLVTAPDTKEATCCDDSAPLQPALRTTMAGAGLLGGRKRGKGNSSQVSHRTVVVALVLSCLLNVIVLFHSHKERTVARMDAAVHEGSRRIKYDTRTTMEGLEARPTSIPGVPQSANNNGLFTTKSIKKGGFVGFYCGEQYSPKEFLEELSGKDDYSISLAKGADVLAADPSNPRHIMGTANEPPEPEQTNMEIVDYFLYAAVNDKGVVPVAVALAMHATKDIEAGLELFWHYGKTYESIRKRKGYDSKSAEKVWMSPENREGLQDPTEVLLDGMPRDCFVSVPERGRGILPFREKGLQDLILRNVRVPWNDKDSGGLFA